MSVRSLRISDDIEAAIRYVARRERTEQSQSLRKLARLGFETYIARAYRGGDVTLREAARLLRFDLWETMDLLCDNGVSGNVTAADVLAGLEVLKKRR